MPCLVYNDINGTYFPFSNERKVVLFFTLQSIYFRLHFVFLFDDTCIVSSFLRNKFAFDYFRYVYTEDLFSLILNL